MPDLTDAELGLDPDQMDTLDPNIRAELRRSRQLAHDLASAQADAEQARKEASFAKAGIPDTPLGQLFAKAYDGDTDPATIKAEFDKLNPSPTPSDPAIPTPPAPTGEDATLQAELDEQRRIAQLSATGQTDGSVPLEDAIRSAKTPEEVLAIVAAAPVDAGIGNVRIE
jgi:hypothetical protein